jgi:hypothetical protein
VVPGAAEALGPAADLRLLTYCRTTSGKINHPSCWNTDEGFAAFFWTTEEYRPPAHYSTDAPVAGCTFLEAARDEWVHSCVIVVNRYVVWRPPVLLMQKLMYDVRGMPFTGEEREQVRSEVRQSLRSAAERLRTVPGVPALTDEAAPF